MIVYVCMLITFLPLTWYQVEDIEIIEATEKQAKEEKVRESSTSLTSV